VIVDQLVHRLLAGRRLAGCHLVELDALLDVDFGHRGAVDQDDDLRLRAAAGQARHGEQPGGQKAARRKY
jgi:hypothetical protein